MRRGSYCPVCTNVWERPHEFETCPNCPGVVLVAVTDWEDSGKWMR